MSKYRIILDGKTYEMEVEKIDGGDLATASTARQTTAPTPMAAPVQSAPVAAVPVQAGSGAVTSPMPGTILRVLVATGDAVKKGQSVMVLEAMKMENEIAAPRDGKIIGLFVAKGDSVQGGAPLFEVGE